MLAEEREVVLRSVFEHGLSRSHGYIRITDMYLMHQSREICVKVDMSHIGRSEELSEDNKFGIKIYQLMKILVFQFRFTMSQGKCILRHVVSRFI